MLANWEIAYIAGFFDGEGCIYAHPSANYIQIEIAQVDRRPLDFVQERYKGRIRLNKTRGHPIHKWMCPATHIEQFLKDILPYSIVKKSQIELALEFRKLGLRPNNRYGQNKEHNVPLKEQRIVLCKAISEAKKC